MVPDNFLFRGVSYNDKNQPVFKTQTMDGQFNDFILNHQILNLTFDKGQRFCIGWVDFENGSAHSCPENSLVDPKYDTCSACRRRTGFNPAFYNAESVSAVQQKINAQPHILYLAYFAPGIIKVGISWEKRGIKRLLEQGARAAIILDTFSSALIARQYEAKIATLDGFIEHLPSRRKRELLNIRYDAKSAESELCRAVDKIEQNLGIYFNSSRLIDTNGLFMKNSIDLSSAIDMTDKPRLAGELLAMIGQSALIKYESDILIYDLKSYVGYIASKESGEISLDIPARQLTFF